MPKPLSNQHILDLLSNLVLPFHTIERHHRLPLVTPRRWENDVEHSWSVAILACAVAPRIDSNLDIGKICQFAIVHDVVELYAGDTKAFAATTEEHASKHSREQAALERIKAKFTAFPWLAQTITEYERLDTYEAQFVYALDKYFAVAYDLLDQGECLRELKITQAVYGQYRAKHQPKAHRHPKMGEYYDQILDLVVAHSEYFYSE